MAQKVRLVFLFWGTLVVVGWNSSATKASLIARYKFDGNTQDSGPNGLHGFLSADPAKRPLLTKDRFGNPNSAYLFDGIDDYIELPYSPLFSPHAVPGGTIRIAAWVKVLAVNTDSHPQGRQPIVSLGKPGEWGYASYIIDKPRASGNWWQKGGANNASAVGGPVLMLDQWYEITVEYRRNEFLRVYVDNTLVAEQTSGFKGVPYTGMNFGPWIGARRDGQYLNAAIDDVRFYNSAMPEPSTVWSMGGLIGLLVCWSMQRRRSRARVLRA